MTAKCMLPVDGAISRLNMTNMTGHESLATNYIVKIRSSSPGNALSMIETELQLRLTDTDASLNNEPLPEGAHANRSATSSPAPIINGSCEPGGAFLVSIYRELLGPAIRGFAACLSPCAFAFVEKHPYVEGTHAAVYMCTRFY